MAARIVAQEGEYVLVVKENQGNLDNIISTLFENPTEMQRVKCDYEKTVSKDHGRLEIRESWTTSGPEYLAYIAEFSHWESLKSLVMVKSERSLRDETSLKCRYFISSLESDAKLLLRAVRTHWEFENEVHWCWILPSGKMKVGSAREMGLKIWRYCAVWRSICSSEKRHPRVVPKPNAYELVGPMIIYSRFFQPKCDCPSPSGFSQGRGAGFSRLFVVPSYRMGGGRRCRPGGQASSISSMGL